MGQYFVGRTLTLEDISYVNFPKGFNVINLYKLYINISFNYIYIILLIIKSYICIFNYH